MIEAIRKAADFCDELFETARIAEGDRSAALH
jgi:hypothetical protein